ncbi:MAG: helix-turn-helix domain-containing protein [Micrococcales bacterium]|nr:helix-turn-helix domain-containing protein [Micrococcales bacterium]
MSATHSDSPSASSSPARQRLRPEQKAAIKRAWAAMVDDAPTIADAITLELFDRDRAFYEHAAPELRAEVRASTRKHVRSGIRTMAGLAASDDRAIHVWRETGRRRAQQGVPLEAVLNAYSYGARVLWESIINLRGNPTRGVDDETLILMGQQVWNALDVQNATACESYRREEALLQRRDLQRQLAVLDGLVQGRGSEPEFAEDARHVLGLDPDEEVLAIVCLADDAPDQASRWAEERLEQLGLKAYWLQLAAHTVGLIGLGGRPPSQVVDQIRADATSRCAVAPSRDGLRGFAVARQLAARAASSLPRGARELVEVRDKLPEVLLAGSPEATRLLVSETLGRLLSQPDSTRQVLLDTLSALLRHSGSPTHAAQELFCHRNTVIYRLKQIEELTGRSLSAPRDRLMMSLAVIALRTSEGEAAPMAVGA